MNSVKNNPKNDRIKREYIIWLREAKQRSTATAEQARHAIDRFEAYNGYKDFATFNKEQAQGFKKHLLAQKAKRSGKTISLSTAHHVLQAIKEFLAWLQGLPEYRRRIKPGDIAYLNLSAGEARQAHASRPKSYASVDQYRAALFAMPSSTEIECRDRALMALMLLTCMRDSAVISLRLKHISVERGHVFQDPREVKTKFSKTIETTFFPVGDGVAEIIRDWVEFLTKEKLFGPDDPLFPKTVMGADEQGNFKMRGLGRECWSNAAPVRKIFRTAFERIKLPYYNPHSIRDTLTQLAYSLKLTPEQLKAWSQNMGHDKPLTTLNSYGHISSERQAELIMELGGKPGSLKDDLATKIAEIHTMLKQQQT